MNSNLDNISTQHEKQTQTDNNHEETKPKRGRPCKVAGQKVTRKTLNKMYYENVTKKKKLLQTYPDVINKRINQIKEILTPEDFSNYLNNLITA